MVPLRWALLLPFASTLALGQAPLHTDASNIGEKPEAVVRRLYHEVVARHPLGIPHGEDRERIVPHLSKELVTRLDTAEACEKDYFRLHQDPHSKPPFEWLEFGLFSGAWEEALPASFHIESTEPEKDGSYRVAVRFTGTKPDSALRWHTTVVVVREKQHFVVDDVIYLKNEDDPQEVEPPMSKTLTLGCDGRRWVGYEAEKAK